MNKFLVTLFATLFMASTAQAAADLIVAIDEPTGVHVYEQGSYDVTVSNVGNKNADGVMLYIDLPQTQTSPNQYLLGTLGSYSGSCTLSAQTLECSLGKIRKNKSKTVSFDIALPYNIVAINIDASVETDSNENSTLNNDDTATPTLEHYAVSVSPPEMILNEHCTGQGLTSFWDCVVSPGSISSHDTDYLSGGVIDFPNEPSYSGDYTISQGGERLQFNYRDGTNAIVATFDGRGVSANCWEGITTFGTSPWISMYSVCK